MGSCVHGFQIARLHHGSERSEPRSPGYEPACGIGSLLRRERQICDAKAVGDRESALLGHHGVYTTAREAVLGHAGEALFARQAFEQLSEYERDSVIEFLKSPQILAPGTHDLTVDEKGRAKALRKE
jgi:hypothetical protein